jgi:hypothetical protein
MIFKVLSTDVVGQGLYFAQDMKLGHYLKIPPRTLFFAQGSATVSLQIFYSHTDHLTKLDPRCSNTNRSNPLDARQRQRHLRRRPIERLHLSQRPHRLLLIRNLGRHRPSPSLLHRQNLLRSSAFLLDRSLDASHHVAHLEILEESRWEWERVDQSY